MSWHYIRLIPAEPTAVPSQDRIDRALARLRAMVPDAEEHTSETTDHVQLYDCGGNFEHVRCPACASDLLDWWQDVTTEDWDGRGFRLRAYPTPCCSTSLTLDELDYSFPMGFARYALSVRGAGFPRFTEEEHSAFEKILGLKLRTIYQQI